jgi:hypothetical protein
VRLNHREVSPIVIRMTVSAYAFVDRECAPLLDPQVGLARVAASLPARAADASPRRRWAGGLAVALALLAGPLGGVASAQSRAPGAPVPAVSKAPLRAIFYSAAPARSRAATKRLRRTAITRRAVARQLAALRWAHADVAIMPWSRPGFADDRALRAVLAAGAKHHRRVRIAALIDRRRGTEVSQIKALASRRVFARGYLHIGSRPAVFVALANRARRNCTAARRWRAAAAGFWLAQGTFAGYERCSTAADAWFSDHGRAHSARAPGTVVIRPGFRHKHATKSQLRRSVAAWRRAVTRMNASGARLQMIDSLNGWGNGTAIGPSSAWRSRSHFGRYLDVLHAHSPRHARRAVLPAVGAPAPSGVTAQGGSIVVTLSADNARSRWWVEFGRTPKYGHTTKSVALPAARAPRAETAKLGALAAGTTYHARVVAASPAGVVAGPDAVFTTPADVAAVVTPASRPGAVDKVLVFVEENHSLDQMKAGMPYLYAQAQQYGYATTYTAISHPSLPNYLAMAFGSTFAVTDDGSPGSHPEAGQDVFTAALQAGRAARSYQESMTSNCALGDQGSYAVKHNPWAYASTPAARAACATGDVPAGTSTAGPLHDDIVSGALPNVGEVTPNLANDAHDGSLATADAWLKGWLTLIYASPDWKSGHLAVIITADEDAGNQGNEVLTTVIHPSLTARVVTTPLTHFSLTQFLSQVGHAPCIGSGCTALSLASAFGLAIA